MLRADFYTQPRVGEVRAGFGQGLVRAAQVNSQVVALCADLTTSVGMGQFRDQFPGRFVQVGVAEQNLVTLAAGFAQAGKIPFAASYAAFSPGRNWEQIRTTICLNNQPVKVIGSHVGLNVGPDGATHQMLEDIALMRALPRMVVLAPGDETEAAALTQLMAASNQPSYMRMPRQASRVFMAAHTDFAIGRAYILRPGTDASLIGTGTMTAELLLVAEQLAEQGLSLEVVHVPTIKPLDTATILGSLRKTGLAITAEEAQVAGGFGSAISELTSQHMPMPVLRLGVEDRFGQSGSAQELLQAYGLTAQAMAPRIQQFIGAHV